ncbi:GNAT family N-acetyltransferase [Burkholderia multivorans]|uniref:GNAT family N-acetyltransferase n=1 Tax=Burkholderia multivorans TaxID=87883 RepID=UPI001C239837|nr:GNAT family N-acetyltransferase [Burkholderia multivorans]MBU9370936.1 GNAT family N-acetyltransferase [Burkholderia multivorans]MCL4651078.1 GNAT family N-acetyltransferase [Burkholderia multivorans]MCL4655702.1 GNAT family N-acetyltransferase [Burkholderia multivorans]MCO1425581.1 GNAT family N-acetyltransferase [Burkholderia multivorans]UQN51743.1 GNAT family N-acetyltransferase [Burkholderia multivorans]
MKHERIDYRTGILSSPAEVAADEWNALLARDAQPTPFLRHEFLDALHVARCAVDETGWSPHFVTLTDARTGRLAAAAPVYAKQHSYGEYVFDWAWADAYQRNGLSYYPKLLCAVPFTPVQGTRLLAVDDDARRRLAATLLAFAEQSDASSLHVLFPTGDEARLLESMGMMLREGVQFHWVNDGYRHFDDFLGTLEQKKRKNIRAERRKVRDAGVTFRRLTGERITDADWRFFTRCYRQTYREHYSSPYLNLDFFRAIGATMPENLLLVIAEADGQPIASALAVYRRGEHGGGTLYGRYWGALEHVPCLHFETAYYQLLEFCIEAELDTFEGGAQGEHKLARGFLPTVTHSAHWLAHPAFADAVAHFLERETEHIHAYVDELREHDPFRRRRS